MNKDCLIGFSLGLGVGVGLGLLFAPRSGAKTQKLIASKIRKSTDYFQDQASGLRTSAVDLFEKGKEQVARQRQGLEHAYKRVMA